MAWPAEPIEAQLYKHGYLLTKDMLDKHDELEYFLNPGTQKRTEAICDGNVKGLCEGVIVQLERKGFNIWTGPLARQSMRSWFCFLRSQLGLRIRIQTPRNAQCFEPRRDAHHFNPAAIIWMKTRNLNANFSKLRLTEYPVKLYRHNYRIQIFSYSG